jgi:hypothetical protein
LSAGAKDNTFIGTFTGNTVTTGIENTLVGTGAGFGLSAGNQNTFVGFDAGNQGSFNVAVGYQAASEMQSGAQYNTCVGPGAGLGITSGTNNTCIGVDAGIGINNPTGNITTGRFNVCIGPNSGATLQRGNNNVFVGSFASTDGDDNICIGEQAGFGTNGDTNIFIGSQLTGLGGGNAATDGSNNICIGAKVGAGVGNSCVFIGENTFLGRGLAPGTDASQAYGIGFGVVIGPDTGSSTSSVDSTYAFGGNISMNVFAVPNPGLSNVAVVGTNLIVDGHANLAVLGQHSTLTNRSNEVVLANSNNFLSLATNGDITITGSTAFKPGGGSWTATSDRRLKHDIALANSLMCENLVRSLPLKRFTWDEIVTTGGDKSQLGFIAQDAEQFMPKSVVTRDMFGLEDCKLLDVSQINFAMYGALQRCIRRIDDLEKTVASLTGSPAPSSGT